MQRTSRGGLGMWWSGILAGCLWLGLGAVLMAAAPGPTQAQQRQSAAAAMAAGNCKDAYDVYAKLVLNPQDEPQQAPSDLAQAAQCLRQLGRDRETDALLEAAVTAHPGNWRILTQAAQLYQNANHNGFLIAGQFERGGHRGGTAKPVNAEERDRVRALQLMEQALKLADAETTAAPGTYDRLYSALSGMLMGDRGYNDAWKLQYLSDLAQLPDYEDGYGGGYRGDGRRGAPVTADGAPVYYAVPASWAAAKNDGERWRWTLAQRREIRARYELAQFLQNQFGVQTMAEYAWFFRSAAADRDDDTRRDDSGTWELHTLKDNETIAKLATGIKRFTLPAADDFMVIYRELAGQKQGYETDALRQLAREYENRRQYDRAIPCWEAVLKHGHGRDNEARRQLDQIRKNWGQFEPVLTQPAGGRGATVEFRFRNANSARFEAVEINVPKLLDDVKDYLADNPKQVDWERTDINNLGWRLVEKNQRRYLMAVAAKWELPLSPRPNHWDRRITVQTPLKKAGAYLLTATLPDGNVSRIVLWVADSALVQKPLNDGVLYFAADAVTGKPLAHAKLDLFGWHQRWVNDDAKRGGKGRYQVRTETRTGVTDADGLFTTNLQVKDKDGSTDSFQWLATLTTPEGRFAYLGFNSVWGGNYYEAEYNQTKVYVMTDRPVYRPEQTVKFKIWLNQAQYDREGKSPFAGQTQTVRIQDPKNEKVFEQELKADAWGGVAGELVLPKTATLGVYRIEVAGNGAGTFRVEEYKKPEFEVTVEAPKEPVMLGETITATVTAKYYFGAPVAAGKVVYKVLRTAYSADWYPARYWDWFYGPGYWWFAYDYPWYPGWREWGTPRPACVWWPDYWRQPAPPEVVMEGEAPVGNDGRFLIRFDTTAAKLMHGDTDHKYEITAEVTDASRRTIVGTGAVLVARRPFKVYAWVDRGWYRTGDVIHASFKAQTLDRKPVAGTGVLRLYQVHYEAGKPVERLVGDWSLRLDAEGAAAQTVKAAEAGQYRLCLTVKDGWGHVMDGGYVFSVMGEAAAADFRFDDLELTTDRAEYQPGDTVGLRVNTNRADATVLLFVRPSNGVYLMPKLLRLHGKSAAEAVAVVKKDMPNFFVEAVTVSDGKVYQEAREIVVPPEQRVLNVAVTPSKEQYQPGEPATVKVKLTGLDGKPYVGSTVLTLYDKAVEYIAGGSNVPEIKEFFWKWRRTHRPQGWSSLDRGGNNLQKNGETGMSWLGVFGYSLADEEGLERPVGSKSPALNLAGRPRSSSRMAATKPMAFDGDAPMPCAAPAPGAPGMMMADAMVCKEQNAELAGGVGGAVAGGDGTPEVQPAIRSNFADTALWAGALDTDANGEAAVSLRMPENLTTWKARVWAMGDGCRVGEGTAETVTSKNLIVRLQAPRFFVQKDEVTLSANIHNYLKGKKKVTARLEIIELDGARATSLDAKVERAAPDRWTLDRRVTVAAGGEERADWRVRLDQPGRITIRVSALTDEESDAMEQTFPVYVHGMEKVESFSGMLRATATSAAIEFTVPRDRRPAETRLEIRWSPTLAGAMVDALPYLVDYPYGCTEQTLNRFLPTVVTQHTLLRMGLDLKAIEQKRTNLNAQEIGDPATRAADWKRNNPPNPGERRNPVFDAATVRDMVKAGLERLESMQCADGGWGWFSGTGEQSWPHTTALVVHGLQVGRACGAPVPDALLSRGVAWLTTHQAEQARRLKLAPADRDYKQFADDLDAFVFTVLTDAKVKHAAMDAFLYRDRNHLSVYAKAMFALACHRLGETEQRDMLRRNVEQYLVRDAENQTAYLKLPEGTWWWCWYGNDIEAMAWYLKLLAAVEPKGETAAGLVKYLVNNRKHATYWNSTRDTAFVLEAFADYLQGSGEAEPAMTVALLVDGREAKRVTVSRDNLFSFDNTLVLAGDAVSTGKHTVELRREGTGPVYFNAYLTNFTLEDPITRAGLEVKVNRHVYKLERVDKNVKVENVRGNAIDQKVEKYERRPLANLAEVRSGDLVEVELVVESKNDYEYILLDDLKAAGFEPVEVRSGYTGNEMGAYVEFRDERVAFFVRALARGTHSVSYRLRAEIPGTFSALPAKAAAMYAPELRANSDEIKLRIRD